MPSGSKDFLQIRNLDSTVTVDSILKPYLDRFLSETRSNIQSLRKAHSEKEWESMRKLSHKIRGSAGSYGFVDLGDCAAVIEDTVPLKDPTKTGHLIGLIENHIATVIIVYKSDEG